jgi:glucose-1-phosphatase
MSFNKTLIFDLGGVIINLKTEAEWIKEDLEPNFHEEQLQLLQQNRFFNDFETGKIEIGAFTRQLKDIAVNPNITDAEIIQHWNAILKDIPAHRVSLLKSLAEKYRLILLSNTNDIHLNAIRSYMQMEFGADILETTFHTCYYSQQIGLRKPGKEIYEFVLQQQEIQAVDSLFLDDKPENLIEPEKLGIQTFLVDFNKLSESSLKHLT